MRLTYRRGPRMASSLRRHMLALSAAVATLTASTQSHAQAQCKYQDERGRCTDKPVFTQKPKSKQKQQIRVVSKPSASVYLIPEASDPDANEAHARTSERRYLGRTPLTWTKRVPPSKYRIRFEADEFEAKEIEVFVSKYGKHWFGTSLKPKPILTIESVEDSEGASETANRPRIEGAKVTIDGVLQAEKTPFRAKLDAGRHKIEVTHEDYRSYKTEIDLAPGEKYDITAILPPERGTLALRSDLINVPIAVYEGHCRDQPAGHMADPRFPTRIDETGLAVVNLTKGNYCVELEVTEMPSIKRSVTIHSGQRTSHEFTLLPQLLPGFYEISVPPRSENERARMAKRCRSASRHNRPSDAECFNLGVQIYQSTKTAKFITPLYDALCQRGHRESCEVYGWLQHTKGKVSQCTSPDTDGPGCRAYREACVKKRLSACYRLHTPRDEEEKRNPLLEYRPLEYNPLRSHRPLPLKRAGSGFFAARASLATGAITDNPAWDLRLALALSLGRLQGYNLSFHIGPYLEGGVMKTHVEFDVAKDQPTTTKQYLGWNLGLGVAVTTTWLGSEPFSWLRLSDLSLRLWGGAEFDQIDAEETVSLGEAQYGRPFWTTGGIALTYTLTRRFFVEVGLSGRRRPAEFYTGSDGFSEGLQGKVLQINSLVSVGVWSN